MADLTGMFAQLNKAITMNPLNMEVGDNLLNRASQGAGNVLANMPGQEDPYSFMNQGAKQLQGKQDLANVDLETAEGLAKAAEISGKMGNTAQAAAFAEKAAAKKAAQVEKVKQQKAAESLAARADKYGLTEDAAALRAGTVTPDMMKEIDKAVRDEQVTKLAAERNTPVRRQLARTLGISNEEFEKEGLAQADAATFTDYVNGKNAKPKAYQGPDGKPVMLVTRDRTGKVRDPESGNWVYPSDLGLAPATQRIQNLTSAADKLVAGMTDLAINEFGVLQEAAVDAGKTMETTDRALNRLNQGAATGVFAPFEIALGKVANELGLEGDWARDARNAEAYASTMGQEVATVIKDFGSGTGLSDADREYALQIAGGDVKLDEGTLRWLLNARRLAARNIKAKHGEILQTLNDNGMDPSVYQILNTVTRSGNTVPSGSGLSESASGYFQ